MTRPGEVPSTTARAAWLERLRARLPAGALATPAALEAPLTPPPDAVARPADLDALGSVVRAARAERVPLVVAGLASRLGGRGALCGAGYLALSSAALSGVREVSPGSLWLRAGAGTPLSELCARAAEHGLRPLGVEPGEPGSLGGFLARQARLPDPITGIDQPVALALEGVLSDGTPLASVAAPRTACGPELASLLTGYEGAFGVVAEARVKLEPMPERRLLLGLAFDEAAAALALFQRLPLQDFPPRRAELELVAGLSPRLRLCVEGDAELAGRAREDLLRAGADAGGRVEDPDRDRGWPDAPAPGFDLEVWVGHGQLAGGLLAPAGLPAPARVRLDRPGLHGCRLGLSWPAGAANRTRHREAFTRALDPDGRQARAAADERELLSRLRARLDPEGRFNAQAWAHAWREGGA